VLVSIAVFAVLLIASGNLANPVARARGDT